MKSPPKAEPSLSGSLGFGLRGRCPRCGRGRLFEGFLAIRERCEVCDLGLAGHDSGDGPAVFGIFILSFGIVGLAGFVEHLFSPPLWVHVLVWTPVIIAGGLLLLRPLKGLMVAIQYRVRSTEESEHSGGS